MTRLTHSVDYDIFSVYLLSCFQINLRNQTAQLNRKYTEFNTSVLSH